MPKGNERFTMKRSVLRFLTLAVAGLLTVCGPAAYGSNGPNGQGEADANSVPQKSITIGMSPGWAEDIAVSYLWKHVLEQHGYSVSIKQLGSGPIYLGLAKGNVDLFFDPWLPTTSGFYWKKYGNRIVDLGIWYKKAPLTITVPAYMHQVNTIGDLKKIGDKVNWTIYGIEPGAGESVVVKNKVMPAYGLDKYTLKTSSTPAMLATLKKAISQHAPAVVTLWRPHWAYSVFHLKDLKDPKHAFGRPDSIHVVSSQQFAKDNPKAAAALRKFTMDDQTLANLEKVVVREHSDNWQQGIEAWAKAHQDYVNDLMH